MDASSGTLLETLRGAPEERPLIDGELRRELQHEIEAATEHATEPLQISKTHLTHVHQCEGRFVFDRREPTNLAMAKGILVHSAIRKTVSGEAPVSPQKLVERMVRNCEKSDKPIGDAVRALTPAERQAFVDELVDFHVVYTTMFPHIPSGWATAEVETAARAGNQITLKGRIDMKLGRRAGDRAGSVLIDFKTGRPSVADRDDLRFYALIETLGTGGQPFRFANVYLNNASYEAEDVTEHTLRTAARRLTDGLGKIIELKAGREPELNPGPACRFCPVKADCASAIADDTGDGYGLDDY